MREETVFMEQKPREMKTSRLSKARFFKHTNRILIIKQTRCTNFSNLFLE